MDNGARDKSGWRLQRDGGLSRAVRVAEIGGQAGGGTNSGIRWNEKKQKGWLAEEWGEKRAEKAG